MGKHHVITTEIINCDKEIMRKAVESIWVAVT